MKLIGIYAYIDGCEADVFRFYADGTYLFSTLKHGPDKSPLCGASSPSESWLARETYPGTTKHAGQVAGSFTLEGSTVTLCGKHELGARGRHRRDVSCWHGHAQWGDGAGWAARPSLRSRAPRWRVISSVQSLRVRA